MSGTYGWRLYPLDPCNAISVYKCRLALIYAGFERRSNLNAIVSSRRCGDNSSFTGQLTQSRTSGSLSISLCHVANRFRIVMLPYFAIAPPGIVGLQDLEVRVFSLHTCFQVLAAAKSTDEENSLVSLILALFLL